MLLALANQHDWHVHQMDVKSAFLNGELNTEIFMKIPPGVEGQSGEVWLLHKALYGLKQASREWYHKLKGQLEGLGFRRSDADYGVFTKIIMGKLFMIAVERCKRGFSCYKQNVKGSSSSPQLRTKGSRGRMTERR